MIIPFYKKNLSAQILEVILHDRIGPYGEAYIYTIIGVIQSFVHVQAHKKYNKLQVSIISFTLFSLKIFFFHFFPSVDD